MAYYDEFLTAIATHVAGKIKYWELWNEPQATPNYCGDIATMVTMAQHASRILKTIDPNAQILSPAANGDQRGPAWLAMFLAAGGSNYVDVIAFHGYWSANAEDVLAVISNFKAAMLANGAGSKPMWDTESSWAGFGNTPAPNNSQQVGFIAKDYILHWSQGVSRFIWYAYDGGSVWLGSGAPIQANPQQQYPIVKLPEWLVGHLRHPVRKTGPAFGLATFPGLVAMPQRSFGHRLVTPAFKHLRNTMPIVTFREQSIILPIILSRSVTNRYFSRRQISAVEVFTRPATAIRYLLFTGVAWLLRNSGHLSDDKAIYSVRCYRVF